MFDFGDTGYEVVADCSSKSEREGYWRAAKGLQKVDGLDTSQYLDEVAEGHITGKYTAQQAACIVEEYYERKENRAAVSGTKEADIVASRIVEILTERTFAFRPGMLSVIHERLFEGILPTNYAGHYRDYNISKPEPVLANRSVEYAPWQLIRDNLEYDFGTFDYRSLTFDTAHDASNFAKFVSNIWETHPFIEGNTRTTAVFCELVFRNKGVPIDNEQFEKHSLFFRNALVRASYSSLKDGIRPDAIPLCHFFENLAFGRSHMLRNRDLYCEELYKIEGLESPLRAFASRTKQSKAAQLYTEQHCFDKNDVHRDDFNR